VTFTGNARPRFACEWTLIVSPGAIVPSTFSTPGRLAPPAPAQGRGYRRHDDGIAAVRAYLEEVWGDAAARFRLAAENTGGPRAAGRGLMEPLELSFTVACPPDHAFAVWATRTA
jgi:hypothetical protein